MGSGLDSHSLRSSHPKKPSLAKGRHVAGARRVLLREGLRWAQRLVCNDAHVWTSVDTVGAGRPRAADCSVVGKGGGVAEEDLMHWLWL